MKRIIIITTIIICMAAIPSACNANKAIIPDYHSAQEYEQALEEGVDTVGHSVTFTVNDVIPNSFFGYNLTAGDHLNFVSDANPKAQAGDTLTVRIKNVRNVFGSWIVSNEMISRN